MSEPTPLLAPTKPRLIAARIWNGTSFVANDWGIVADDDTLPVAGKMLVSLKRWRAERLALIGSERVLGVHVLSAQLIDIKSDVVERLGLITLDFPKFTDGRSYSNARRLYEAGYAGDIRATGDVLVDQLPIMLRAGFKSFEITNAATARFLDRQAVPSISQVYQAGSEHSAHTWYSRRVVNSRSPSPLLAERVL